MSISKIHKKCITKLANDICEVVKNYYVGKGKKMNERRYAILNRYFIGIETVPASFRGQNYRIPGKLSFRQRVSVQVTSAFQNYEITTLIGLHKALKALVAECDREAFWRTSSLSNNLRQKVLPFIEESYHVAWEADIAYNTKLQHEKALLQERQKALELPKRAVEPADTAAGTGAMLPHMMSYGGLPPGIHRELSHMQQQMGVLTGYVLASSPHFSRGSSPVHSVRSAPGHVDDGYSDEERYPVQRRQSASSWEKRPLYPFEDEHVRSHSVGRAPRSSQHTHW